MEDGRRKPMNQSMKKQKLLWRLDEENLKMLVGKTFWPMPREKNKKVGKIEKSKLRSGKSRN